MSFQRGEWSWEKKRLIPKNCQKQNAWKKANISIFWENWSGTPHYTIKNGGICSLIGHFQVSKLLFCFSWLVGLMTFFCSWVWLSFFDTETNIPTTMCKICLFSFGPDIRVFPVARFSNFFNVPPTDTVFSPSTETKKIETNKTKKTSAE